MKRFAKLLLITVGFGALGFVMSLVPQKNATGAGGAPVIITSPLPLPVTGNVNATVNGPIAAQQSGTWNVGITGTPTVNANVAFPAALAGTNVPVSVRRSADFKTLIFVANVNGFGGQFSEVLPDGTVSTSAFAIPQGEQFVITDVSWDVFCNPALGVCPVSAGDAAEVTLGFFYRSETTWASTQFGIFRAGHSDHLTSGIVVNQLPQTSFAIFFSFGVGFSNFTLQGYLLPVT